MSEIARRIDEVIREGLAPVLKAYGYKKDRRNFRRREAECTRVVNVQGSAWNADNQGSFTINLGVYFPAVVPFLDGMRVTDRPAEVDCVARERIGYLLPAQRDYWWDVSSETDPGALAREVREAWEQFGAAWMDAHSSMQAARALALKHNLPYWAAAISLALEEREAAGSYLEEALVAAKRSATVTARLRDWGGRHGIIP